MRKVFMVMAAALLMAQSVMAADTLLLSEDFESYTDGQSLETGGTVTWTIPDAAAGSANGTYTAAATSIVGGGTLSGVFLDNSSTNEGFHIGITDPDLAAGVQKGRVELDMTVVTSTNTGGFWISLYDDFAYDTALNSDKSLAYRPADLIGFQNFARGTANPSRIIYGVNEGPWPTWLPATGAIAWVGGNTNDYHLSIEFDCAARTVTFTTTQLDPAPGPVDSFSGTFISQPADNFSGLKGISFDTQSNRSITFQVDNIKVYEVSTGPAPEVAVTVDAADVADGGTVDFGAPAVGVPTSKTFTVANTGTADLTTSNLVLPTGYSLASGSDLAATIAASSSDDFIIELDTTTPGIKDGEITFDTNDSDENPFNIGVTANVGSTTVEEWTER